MNIGKKGDTSFALERFVAIAIAIILISILAYVVWRVKIAASG